MCKFESASRLPNIYRNQIFRIWGSLVTVKEQLFRHCVWIYKIICPACFSMGFWNIAGSFQACMHKFADNILEAGLDQFWPTGWLRRKGHSGQRMHNYSVLPEYEEMEESILSAHRKVRMLWPWAFLRLKKEESKMVKTIQL